MKDFIYNIPTKIYFGRNQLGHLSEELLKYGTRVLVTSGGGSIKRIGLYDKVMAELQGAGMTVFELSGIEPNPRIDSVRKGAAICKEQKIDVILAIGGGSTIDATKFIAAGACVEHDPWDFFIKGAKIDRALPVVSILTVAATGSEMNPGGVISNMETKDKLAASSPCLFPKVSFLNPEVTYTVNQYQTACGAADILSHIFEIYFNPSGSMFMLDSMMEGLMKTVIKYAPIALDEPENYEARANLMWASSWGISGLIRSAQTCVWSCHPMEHELSAVYDITHGLGLAILTPRWMKYCLDAGNVDRYEKLGVNVFGIDPSLSSMEIAQKAIEATSDFLFNRLHLDDSFEKVGIRAEDFEQMAAKACRKGCIAGFKTLYAEDVKKIYEMCLS